uniref:hypothetical protein n=1 Tax=Marinifilum fragile TaxID=570161 RepID=UPI001C46C16F
KIGCLVGVNNHKKDSYDHPTTAYKILLNNHFINPLSVESGCKYNRGKTILPNKIERKFKDNSQITDLQLQKKS